MVALPGEVVGGSAGTDDDMGVEGAAEGEETVGGDEDDVVGAEVVVVGDEGRADADMLSLDRK